MEDLLYFIQKNPWVAFIIVFWILRRIFGGGEKAKKQKEELAARRAEVKEKQRRKAEQVNTVRQARKEGGLSGEGILAQIQRQIEEAVQQAENTARGQIGSSETVSMSRPEVRMSGPTDEESAASEMERTNDLFAEPTAAMSRPVVDTPTDYDLNDKGFEYHSLSEKRPPSKPDDLQWHMTKQVSTLDAFAFNPADNQPAEVSYHTKPRHYVSAARIAAPQVSAPEEERKGERVAVGELLSNADSLTRAFILQEILGPPRGMRRARR